MQRVAPQHPFGSTSGLVLTRQEITVKQAYDGELQRSLTSRQSAEATMQMSQVAGIMAQNNLTAGRDQRCS
jgi:hypothetical protein